MSKLSRLTPLLAVLVLAGCGGHSTQHRYHTAHGIAAHSPTFGLPPKGLRAPAPVTGVATVEQFDSVTISTVPSWARAVAGYTSGFWPTYLPLVRAFPHAYHVSIAINVSHTARCLDVEPGDASPSQVVYWFHLDVKAGYARPCFYAALFNGMGTIRANLSRAGIARSRYLLFDADWVGCPHLDSGYDATQCTSTALNRNLDESTVTLAFLGVTPKPQLHCFGRHAQLHNATCERVRPLVAKWSRARDGSARALTAVQSGLRAHACRVPYRRDICVDLGREIAPVLRQRERYYAGRVIATLKAYG